MSVFVAGSTAAVTATTTEYTANIATISHVRSDGWKWHSCPTSSTRTILLTESGRVLASFIHLIALSLWRDFFSPSGNRSREVTLFNSPVYSSGMRKHFAWLEKVHKLCALLMTQYAPVSKWQ